MRTSDYGVTTSGNVAFGGLPYTPQEVREFAGWLLKVADTAEEVKQSTASKEPGEALDYALSRTLPSLQRKMPA